MTSNLPTDLPYQSNSRTSNRLRFTPTTPPDIQLAFQPGHATNESARARWWAENQHRLPQPIQMPTSGDIMIHNAVRDIDQDPDGTDIWAMRMDEVITEAEQRRLLARWEAVEASGAKAYHSKPKPGKKPRHLDPKRPVHHHGRWSKRGNPVQLTRGTRQPTGKTSKERESRRRAVLTWLAELDKVLQGRIRRRLDRNTDRGYGGQRKITAVAGRELESIDLQEVTEEDMAAAREATGGGHPLRLGGVGLACAVTRGQADVFHLDPGDEGWTVVFVVAPDGLGDEDEDPTKLRGQLELPQLGVRIPLRPGQAIAFRAARLLHKVTMMRPEEQDRRVAVTVFTCKGARAQGLERRKARENVE